MLLQIIATCDGPSLSTRAVEPSELPGLLDRIDSGKYWSDLQRGSDDATPLSTVPSPVLWFAAFDERFVSPPRLESAHVLTCTKQAHAPVSANNVVCSQQSARGSDVIETTASEGQISAFGSTGCALFTAFDEDLSGEGIGLTTGTFLIGRVSGSSDPLLLTLPEVTYEPKISADAVSAGAGASDSCAAAVTSKVLPREGSESAIMSSTVDSVVTTTTRPTGSGSGGNKRSNTSTKSVIKGATPGRIGAAHPSATAARSIGKTQQKTPAAVAHDKTAGNEFPHADAPMAAVDGHPSSGSAYAGGTSAVPPTVSSPGATLEDRLLAAVPPPDALSQADPGMVAAELCGWVAALQQAYRAASSSAASLHTAYAGEVVSVQLSLEDALSQKDALQSRVTLLEARVKSAQSRDTVSSERASRLAAENARLRDEAAALPVPGGSASRPGTGGSQRPGSTDGAGLQRTAHVRRTGSDVLGGVGAGQAASVARPRTGSVEHAAPGLSRGTPSPSPRDGAPSIGAATLGLGEDPHALRLRLRQAEEDARYLRQSLEAEAQARVASEAATQRLLDTWAEERARLRAAANGGVGANGSSSSAPELAQLQARSRRLEEELAEARRARDAAAAPPTVGSAHPRDSELQRAYARLDSLQRLHAAEVTSVRSSTQAEHALLADSLRRELEAQLTAALTAAQDATVAAAEGGRPLSEDATAILVQLKAASEQNRRVTAEVSALRASLAGAAVVKTALAATQAALQEARAELERAPRPVSAFCSLSPAPSPLVPVPAVRGLPTPTLPPTTGSEGASGGSNMAAAASSLAVTQAQEALAAERAAHERTRTACEAAQREVRSLTAKLQQQAAEASVQLSCVTAQVRAEAAELLSQAASSRQSDVESAVATAVATAVQRESDTWRLELHRQRESDRAAAASELASALATQLAQMESTMRQALAAAAGQAAFDAQDACTAALAEAEAHWRAEVQAVMEAAAAASQRATSECDRLGVDRDRAAASLADAVASHAAAVSSLTAEWQTRVSSLTAAAEEARSESQRLQAIVTSMGEQHAAALAAAAAEAHASVASTVQRCQTEAASALLVATQTVEAAWQGRLREVQAAASQAVSAAAEASHSDLAAQLAAESARSRTAEQERDALAARLAEAQSRLTLAEVAAHARLAEAKASFTADRDAQVAADRAASATKYQADLTTLREAQDARIAALVAELSESVSGMRHQATSERGAALEAAARDHEARLAAVRADHASALAQVHAQMKAQSAKHAADVSRMETLITALRGAATSSASTTMLNLSAVFGSPGPAAMPSLTMPASLASVSGSSGGPVSFTVPYPPQGPPSSRGGLPQLQQLFTPGGGRTPTDAVSVAVVEARRKSELARALSERDASWQARLDALQGDNTKAAGIMAGLLAESEGHARAADGLRIALERASADKAAVEASAAHLTEAALRLEDELDAARARAEELEAARNAAVAQVHAAATAATMALGQAQCEWEAQLSRLHQAWGAERTSLCEIADAKEGATVASAVRAARQQAAESAAEELRALTGQFESKLAQLQSMHDSEMGSLRRTAEADAQSAASRARAEREAAVAAAVERAQAADAAAMSARLTHIETEVTKELGRITTEAAYAHATAVRSLQDQHERQTTALRQESDAALAAAIARYDSELASLHASTVPLEAVTQMRAHLEADAGASLRAGIDSALADADARLAHALDAAGARLSQVEGECARHRETVARQEAKLSGREAGAADALCRALAEAATLSHQLDDARATVARLSREADEHRSLHATTFESASGLQASLEHVRGEAAQALAHVQAQATAELADASARLELASEAWSQERASLVSQLATLQRDAEAAVADARSRLTAAQADAEAAHAGYQAQHEQAIAGLAHELQQRFEAEVADVQARMGQASESRLREALAQAAATHASQLDAFRSAAAQQLEAVELEARSLHAALAAAGNEQTRAALGAAMEAAAAERGAALAQAAAERDASLEALAARADETLATLRREQAAQVETLASEWAAREAELRASFDRDLTDAMTAARAEAGELIRAAEDVASAAGKEALAARDADHAAVLTSLQAAAAEAHARLAEEHASQLQDVQEQHAAQVAALHAEREVAVAHTRAACDADRVAALGAAAGSAAHHLTAALAHAATEADARVTALQAEYQAALDTTASVAEVQRTAAVEALLADAEAERDALTEAANAQLAQALEHAHQAAEAALSEAIAMAEQQQREALANAEERYAAHLETTVLAEREAAAASHASALAALRGESESLLTSIEGAMTRLRDERDVARETLRETRETLAGKDGQIEQRDGVINELRCTGALVLARHALEVGSLLSSQRAREEELRDAAAEEVAQTVSQWQGRLEDAVTTLQLERGRVAGLGAMRTRLLEALTSFKRDALLGARSRASELTANLAGLAAARAQLASRRDGVSSAVGEAEGAARALERELGELSRSSVISADGTVNTAAARRKKRLDRDLDDALVRLASARKDLSELDAAGKALEDRRRDTEGALGNVEGELVGALLSQQRALMGILTEAAALADGGSYVYAVPSSGGSTGTLSGAGSADRESVGAREQESGPSGPAPNGYGTGTASSATADPDPDRVHERRAAGTAGAGPKLTADHAAALAATAAAGCDGDLGDGDDDDGILVK